LFVILRGSEAWLHRRSLCKENEYLLTVYEFFHSRL
jgi:hypothetical protein